MQELALLLTGIAGAASAAAFTKFPRNTGKLGIIGANPRIQREIAAMQIERDILTKTITRLYQRESGISGERRGKLLGKYQHQLGVMLARIEKLETARNHPDMGPVGDGLVTLMDQKLSGLDEKLHEISSKISIASAVAETKTKASHTVRKEKEPSAFIPKVPRMKIPETPRDRVEITTLTPVTTGSQFRAPPPRPEVTAKPESVVPQPEYKPVSDIQKPSTVYRPVVNIQKPEMVKKMEGISDVAKIEQAEPPVLTEPAADIKDLVPEQDKDLESTDDLDKLKKDIMRTLEKLDQVEVE